MTCFLKSRADVLGALQNPARAAPASLLGRAGERPEKRFSVYRNNVYVSLVEAIRVSYPVTQRLVGEAFFHAMARAYVAQELPRSPVLLEYGGGFADFIAAFEPARALPYLVDVARHEAHHAADVRPLAPAALTSVPPERLGSMVPWLHPSLRLLRSRWPVLSIWQTNSRDAQVRRVTLDAGEHVAVLRPALEVSCSLLPSGGSAFLSTLAQGDTLERAVAAAQSEEGGPFELVETLQWMLSAGVIVGYRLAEKAQGGRTHERH
jgi:hypothetical protein